MCLLVEGAQAEKKKKCLGFFLPRTTIFVFQFLRNVAYINNLFWKISFKLNTYTLLQTYNN